MIGSEIIHFKRVDSTSNYIATLLKESKVVNGLVILADEQTEGRGQRGAKWQSIPGENLLLSFFIEYKQLEVNKQKHLTQAVSIAILQTLYYFQVFGKIKWPNDIVIAHKKIAGILIENQFQGKNIKSSIIGIGLNVLQKEFETINSTSISIESQASVNLKLVLNQLIYQLNQQFILLAQKSFDVLEQNYIKSLWLKDEVSFYEKESGEIFKGIIKGIDSEGKLLIYRDDLNAIETYGLKEIKFTKRNVQ
jgi:BirA family transcriptional regulator, biotin operon repressor / biotin---[acetyl-CoA-carboxylase] ligase